jgi:3',5'-cyclic AMP phosphodiesterase CpdA
MKRREFLTRAVLAGAASVVQPGYAKVRKPGRAKSVLRFGICADLHHDLITDGVLRLQAFIAEMKKREPDFILQIGDFCTPKEKNREVLDVWNQFPGPKYHVAGNHDVDGGFTLDQTLKFWGVKAPYYSFDVNGYHLVVLNANERTASDGTNHYPRSVGKEQREWLKHDLASTSHPVMIFCHQGIDNDIDGVQEGNHLRWIFEQANREAGFRKVRFVFSGHHHCDYHNIYNGIHYLQINSISYQFKHMNGTYEFAHSKDPLWAFISIDSEGNLSMEGRRSVYENGSEVWDNDPGFDEYPTVARISAVQVTMA